jgi:putative ABC transport system permease protein
MISERFRWLRTKCSRLFRRRKHEAALDAELQFHFDQLVAQFRSEGMSERAARLAAQREFGAVSAYREEIRDTWRPPELADLWRSLRFAVRSLIRTPGFTLIAITTLGLGIGANTAMFSIVNKLLLKPLPYFESAQLDAIYRVTPQSREGDFSPADFLDLQRAAKEGYGDVAAYAAGDASLSEPGHAAEMASAARSTANLLSLLGVQPQLGRDFRSGEDTPGRERIVILSQRTWRNRFGLDPNIIGRTIRIDGEPHEVVGVLPETFNDFRHLGSIDLFRPLALSPPQSTDRSRTVLKVIGRRSPAHSGADAGGFIANFGARLAREFPEANAESTWRTVPLEEAVKSRNNPMAMMMLVGLSGFVLLIACSNLANLLLARTMARAREFAVRAALGASRAQLLRPLVVESLLLALAGGIGASLVAVWFRDWAAARSLGENGEAVIFVVDWRVLGWAFAASVVTALAFGMAPALYALRLDLNSTLKSGGRATTGSRGHQRFRQVLIIGQFALAMVLLTGAGLFICGLDDMNDRRAGWESSQLVTGTLLLPASKYSDADKITAFHRLAVERLGSLPGVASVSISAFTPFFDWPDTRKFFVEGRERPEPGHEPAAAVNNVSPEYFETFTTRVLSGRVFDQRDTASSSKVFVISQSTARGLFGNEDPIGRRVAQAEGDNLRWGEIVGVVADVRPVVEKPSPVLYQIYQPMAQEPRAQNEIAVRVSGVDPASVVESLRTTIAALDPDLPVRSLQPADVTIERGTYGLVVLRDILAAFAVLGLGLASLGVYGVIARTMAQRAGEFAIRLALGASIQNITRMVLASGVKLALYGSALGLLGAFGIARLLAAAFPDMEMSAPGIITGTAFLLIAVALVACWLPARRAAQVDTMSLLRAE